MSRTVYLIILIVAASVVWSAEIPLLKSGGEVADGVDVVVVELSEGRDKMAEAMVSGATTSDNPADTTTLPTTTTTTTTTSAPTTTTTTSSGGTITTTAGGTITTTAGGTTITTAPGTTTTTAPGTTTTTTGPDPGTDPDALMLVDKIIIGVTVGTVCGVIIGGIVMYCVNKSKAKKAKKAKERSDRMLQEQRLGWDNTTFKD